MLKEDTALKAIETICARLSDRTATLFLGAGINANIHNNAGETFPLGKGLSQLISRDLLDSPELNISLDDAAEMARFRLGNKVVNDYIYEQFSQFNPSTAHLALVQLPWDVIYTTNYDLLVEKAAETLSVEPAGKIQAVFSMHRDLTFFSEEDILYYKLHGSIDVANTEEGRLILTKEDYRHYELYRKPLFKRLERDLQRRTFVFVGYSLADNNFRGILEDCRHELGTRTLPLSFVVRPHFTEVEEVFLRDKYNIQLIKADADEFLNSLKDTWISQNYSIESLETRRSKVYLLADQSTSFPKIAESFYQIDPKNCTGQSNAKLFFSGSEPSWDDIRDKVAPYRDAYWLLLDSLWQELSQPNLPPSLYLVTGAAGTGKTTLIRSLAYDLAKEFSLVVLMHIPDTPLDACFLGSFVDDKNLQRIIVVIRHPSENIRALEQFFDMAKQRSLPLTIVLEERKNQWKTAISTMRSRLTPIEFELSSLSQNEITTILDALAKYDALGKLTGSTRDYQENHFTALAHKELLVALRELTSGVSFDDIIRDEFNKIPSDTAKHAYAYVSALGQIDLAIRYETIIHLLNLRYDQLNTEVFRPTEGVLISGEETGKSRHNAGFRLMTRHPVIASIIFALVAPNDDAKFDIFNRLLAQLDPGYQEDQRLLNAIVRKRELVSTLESHERRRAIYERLEAILPDDSYVLQHRSILERELGNPDLSLEYARKALKLDSNNLALQNTLGLALEFAARSLNDPLRRQAYINEATKIFDEGIRRNPTDPYGYLGRVYIIRQTIYRERDSQRKLVHQANALSFLEEAYEATGESSVIVTQLALQRDQLGTTEDAIEILKDALGKDPTNTRLRDLWIRFEMEKGRLNEALEIALEGTRHDPTSWRLQRYIARLRQRFGAPTSAVKGHYEAAIRHHKGDIAILVELATYLFMQGQYSDAKAVFIQARNLPASSEDKQMIRETWQDNAGRPMRFFGKVQSIRGAAVYALAIPQNFEVFFWRNHTDLSELREGDSISFYVGFNAFGATALIIH